MTTSFTSFTSKDIAGYTNRIYDLKWNTDGNYLACLSHENTVKIGQLDNNNGNYQNIHNIPNSTKIAQLCWNPTDHQRLAICGEDKYVGLWDVRSSRSSGKISSVGGHINITWSSCGNYIATGNKNDVLAVLDTRMCILSKKKKTPYLLNELAWTYDSNYILAATGADRLGAIDIIQFKDQELRVVDSIVGHTSDCVSILSCLVFITHTHAINSNFTAYNFTLILFTYPILIHPFIHSSIHPIRAISRSIVRISDSLWEVMTSM